MRQAVVGSQPRATTAAFAADVQVSVGVALRIMRVTTIDEGNVVSEFERELARLIEVPKGRVVTVSTGHAALHLSLLLAGVGTGDQVVTPSFNNVSDLQAILATGGEPVFCDIDPETACIDVAAAESAGAKLRVKSSEAGWVQFVDPAAKKSGWISLANLAPAEREPENESTASKQPEQPQPIVAARPTQPQRTANLKPPKQAPKVRQLTPTYTELPTDREFMPPRRGGLFGLFWKRRLTADQFSPPRYP